MSSKSNKRGLVKGFRFFKVIGACLQPYDLTLKPPIFQMSEEPFNNMRLQAESTAFSAHAIRHQNKQKRSLRLVEATTQEHRRKHDAWLAVALQVGQSPSTVSFAYFPTGCVIASRADKVASAAS